MQKAKLYRGTTYKQAKDLLNDFHPGGFTHWVETFERALMYSRGAVVKLVFDQVPKTLRFYERICHGDDLHGTFKEYRIPKNYYEQVLCNWFENESTIIQQEEKEDVFDYSRKRGLGPKKLRELEIV